MTGKPPYHYIRTVHFVLKVVALIRAVAIEKETPKRPEECIPSNTSYGDALWLLLTSCWEYEPEKRPRARNVLVQMVSLNPGKRSEANACELQMEGVTRDKSISPQAASVLEPEAEPEAGSVEDQPTKQHQQERGDSWFEHGPKEV
ncbi:hypothetical protein FRC09_005270 [Ceratobasidium sp. 395]|nr:hypothetical protein FRC09_005270 [Ceratobasidium sp. 395]